LTGLYVTIAGGHGKIARRLTRLLVERGWRVRGLIRDPGQAGDLRSDGAEPVVCDLESAGVDEIAQAIRPAHAVVFAAGAGPGSGPERKLTLDRDGAIKTIEATRALGIERYVMISSLGAEDPPDGDDVFSVYLRAKAEADRALVASGLAWTIVRPGHLTNDPGDRLVRIDDRPLHGEVSRDDVAETLAAVLAEPRSKRRTLYVVDGQEPVEWQLEAVLSAPAADEPQADARV
jgi:uncharacterized protein YbjT (DUF2867 family)